MSNVPEYIRARAEKYAQIFPGFSKEYFERYYDHFRALPPVRSDNMAFLTKHFRDSEKLLDRNPGKWKWVWLDKQGRPHSSGRASVNRPEDNAYVPEFIWQDPAAIVRYLKKLYGDRNPTDKQVLSQFVFLNECTGAYSGQVNMRLGAFFHGDEYPVGFIDYSIWEGSIHILMMEVRKDLQRKGLATALWAKLKEANPGVKIYPGFATADGMAFLRTVGYGNKQQAIGKPRRNPSSEWHGEQAEVNRQKAAEAEGTPMETYYNGKLIGHMTFSSHWHDIHDQKPFHTIQFKGARQTYAETVDRYTKMEWKYPADPQWAMRWKGIVDADIESLKKLGMTDAQIRELNPRRRNPTPDYSFLRQYTIGPDGKPLFHAIVRVDLRAKDPEKIVDYLDWLLRVPGVKVRLEKQGGLTIEEREAEKDGLPGGVISRHPALNAYISVDADQRWSDLSDAEIYNIIEGAYRYRLELTGHKTTFWGTLDPSTGQNWRGSMLDLGFIRVTSRSMRRLNEFLEETWPQARAYPMQRYYRAKGDIIPDVMSELWLDGPAPERL